MKIKLSFIAMLCFFFVCDTDGILPYFILSSTVHELGHIAMIYLTGASITSFTLSATGGNIAYTYHGRNSYLKDILVFSSGIFSNIILAFAFANNTYISGSSMILALFNLLPIYPLDGGRILLAILSYLTNSIRAYEIIHTISYILSLLLLLLGVFVFFKSSYNISIMLIAIILIYLLIKNKKM